MDFFSLVILALALSWASGINVYGVFVALGFGSLTGLFQLPQTLDFTTYPLVLTIATFMFVVEFFVDKIPLVDSGWDSFHTFIRVVLGAFLASQVFGEESLGFLLFVGLIGAFIAGSSHTLKASSRVVVNSSPEPFSNTILSFVEDVVVFGGIFLAFKYPFVFLIFFIAYIFAFIWLMPKVFKGVKKVFHFLFDTPNDSKINDKNLIEHKEENR